MRGVHFQWHYSKSAVKQIGEDTYCTGLVAKAVNDDLRQPAKFAGTGIGSSA